MELADAADTDEIRERILTGFKDGKPSTPYVPTLPPAPAASARAGGAHDLRADTTLTDCGERMLDVTAARTSFDARECVDVDHDPVTHQLRVLVRMSFSAALAFGNERHFELLLRTRR